VAGIVSNSIQGPDTGKKCFPPCTIGGLIAFLQNIKRE